MNWHFFFLNEGNKFPLDLFDGFHFIQFICLKKSRMDYKPGDNSDTGVLDGVGLWPGGRKLEGEPLLEPGAPNKQIINRKIAF